MGANYNFKCNKCGYKALTTGGHDFGMVAVTDTYICTDCKRIIDVTVGEYGKTFTKEEILIKKKNDPDLHFFVCPACGSDKNLIKWDENIRPCPKCDGEMKKENKGPVLMWD